MGIFLAIMNMYYHNYCIHFCVAPSGTPQSFTGYLSHLHNSAKFRWGAVDERETNGLVIGYDFSCNYSNDEGNQTFSMPFNNVTFQFELDIVESSEYECAIAASTSAGRGPNTAPVYFTTPGNAEGTHFTQSLSIKKLIRADYSTA